MKYTTDGKYAVWAGKRVIALAYWGGEVRILQGMPRMETIERIAAECPEFLTNNEWSVNRVPKLFTEKTGKEFAKEYKNYNNDNF